MRQRRDPEMLELSDPVQGELPLGPPAPGAAPAAAPKPKPPSAAEQLPAPWLTFLTSLTDVLRELEDGHRLELRAGRAGHFVAISGHGAAGLAAETGKGRTAERSPQQRADDLARLRRLGWERLALERAPRHGATRADEQLREWPHPAPLAEVGLLAVRTLREVWGVAHPRELLYAATDSSRREILLPTLRLNRRPRDPNRAEGAPPLRPANPRELVEAVQAAMRAHTGLAELAADAGGSIRLHRRAIALRIHVAPSVLALDLYATIASDAEATPELLAVLNDASFRSRAAAFSVFEGNVYASATVPGGIFVPELLTDAFDRLMDDAEALQGTLRQRFAGAMFFDDRFEFADSGDYRVN